MRVLIIGSGGREHALAWKVAQSPLVSKIYVAPGNEGMSTLAEILPLAASDNRALLQAAQELQIDLTIVGPDDVLASGLVDLFQDHNLKIYGPKKEAARLEWSKDYSKDFMTRHAIPTASWISCPDKTSALVALASFNYPLAIKANGLALGKGVSIVSSFAEATKELDRIDTLGAIVYPLVIEDFLVGRELSLHLFLDGKNYCLMPLAEDHKQAFEKDQGPNTGGMGTVAPLNWLNHAQIKALSTEIIEPTMRALQAEGIDYRGTLFIGIMVTAEGPKVIEFNSRFGDPETQVMMPLLQSDIIPIMLSCIDGTLNQIEPIWVEDTQTAVCVILASPGYPESSTKGLVIEGLDYLPTAIIPFYAGIKKENNQWLTNGGRVLGLTACANDLGEAQQLVYDAVNSIDFTGKQFRNDIGNRAKPSYT